MNTENILYYCYFSFQILNKGANHHVVDKLNSHHSVKSTEIKYSCHRQRVDLSHMLCMHPSRHSTFCRIFGVTIRKKVLY